MIHERNLNKKCDTSYTNEFFSQTKNQPVSEIWIEFSKNIEQFTTVGI